MSALEWVGLTIAFLAPMSPERPEPLQPLPGNEWVASLIMASVVAMMVVPMITIWTFHRPIEALRARCEASGGHLTPTSLDGPYRCDREGRR